MLWSFPERVSNVNVYPIFNTSTLCLVRHSIFTKGKTFRPHGVLNKQYHDNTDIQSIHAVGASFRAAFSLCSLPMNVSGRFSHLISDKPRPRVDS